MNFRAYVLDRLPLLLAFAAGLVFILLVLHLTAGPLMLSDALYALLLALVFACLILGVDYLRHRQFRGALAKLLAGDLNTVLPPGANREQRMVRQALSALRRDYLGRLKANELAAENHRVFIDQWVHQMKTPLAVLDLSAQSDDGAAELRAAIMAETDSLQHGLDMMLTAARLDRFELDLKPASIDLFDLVRGTVNELKASWLRAEVYPRVLVGTSGITVQSDPKWLRVVVRQLLTNAIKYSESGGHVEITVLKRKGKSLLEVRDHGLGIPAADLPRIFDRFFTGHNGRLRPAATGMGLHLAAEICNRLGHGLTVESEVSSGSTFTVTFNPRSLTDL